MKRTSAFILSLLLASNSVSGKVATRLLGKFDVKNPAFVSIEQFDNQDPFMLISAFSMYGDGIVEVVPNIGDKVKSKDFSSIKTNQISNEFTWPNKIETVPSNVFGSGYHAISVPDGFIPPGHKDGNVFIITTDPNNLISHTGTYQISADKSGYFYHMGQWIDVNQDGRLDYVTARTNGKEGKGELIYLEHPEGGLTTVPWNEHVLAAGPDVMFQIVELSAYPDSFIVFAAEFFNEKLSVYQIQKGTGALLNSKDIDTTIQSVYSVTYADINADGYYELLVNNHEKKDKLAGIFLYAVPTDLFGGVYERTTIANGFKNAPSSLFVSNMCPGFPYAVHPATSMNGEPSYILVAGDGDYSVHLMTPNTDGTFTRTTIEDLKGTVGSLAYSDVDGDGWLEFFVPNYDKNYIEVYQFYDDAASTEEEQTFLA